MDGTERRRGHQYFIRRIKGPRRKGNQFWGEFILSNITYLLRLIKAENEKRDGRGFFLFYVRCEVVLRTQKQWSVTPRTENENSAVCGLCQEKKKKKLMQFVVPIEV